MKKIFAVLLMLVMLCSFVSCGENKDVVDVNEDITVIDKDAEFEAVYTKLYMDLQTLSKNCDTITDTINDVWRIVGVDYVKGTISYMMQLDSDFSAYWNKEKMLPVTNYEWLLALEYDWMHGGMLSGITGRNDAVKFHNLCMEFQDAYSAISSTKDALSGKIKELYAEYKDDYSYEYDLINNLYLEVSVYAEFALEVSGSLSSYSVDKRNMQAEISKLIKAADIY